MGKLAADTSANTVVVEDMLFTFPGDWEVEDFDSWYGQGHGTKPLTDKPFNAKDCDLLALEGDRLWLIEVKDYTYPGKKIDPNLPRDFALKVFHTMARLVANAYFGTHHKQEFCKRALRVEQIKVALAVEARGNKTTLYKALADLNDLVEAECRKMKIARVVIANSQVPSTQFSWTQKRLPETRSNHTDR